MTFGTERGQIIIRQVLVKPKCSYRPIDFIAPGGLVVDLLRDQILFGFFSILKYIMIREICIQNLLIFSPGIGRDPVQPGLGKMFLHVYVRG